LKSVKAKLESALDESEENCEKEKKAKADLDKAKRKLEADLKTSQAHVEEGERARGELHEVVRRKDAEIKAANDKSEETMGLVAQAQRKNKEFQVGLNLLFFSSRVGCGKCSLSFLTWRHRCFSLDRKRITKIIFFSTFLKKSRN
jgi:hypothetical protein